MSTLKPISADSYQVHPFVTHKLQHYEYTYLGNDNPDGVYIDLAVKPPSVSNWGFDPDVEIKNPDGVYQRTLYPSVQHLLYDSASLWNSGVTRQFPSGSQFYVIHAAQSTYGEGLQPGSFRVSESTTDSIISDDGDGNLKESVSGNIIGNVFYGMGVAVIQYSSGSSVNPSGIYLQEGSQVDITFRATQTIYEHNVMCSIEPGELGYSINPSMEKKDLDGNRVFDAFASGSLVPYMSTVGLYNDKKELVAVAKFPRPIKRAVDSQQTFIIRWDV